MNKFIFIILILITFYSEASDTAPKNVLFILADDLGWNDTGVFQENRFLETPNIDALAARGMVFSNAYASSPLCSPTRASILTGQTPARHGSTAPLHHLTDVRLTPVLPDKAAQNKKSIAPLSATRLDTAIPTLSSILKSNGYQTAHFGKWHLGTTPYSPLEHGFEIDIPHYDGSGPSGGYLAPWRFAPKLRPEFTGQHIDIRLAQEANRWINKVKNKGPFFLNFWAFSVHAPYNADPKLVDYFANKATPFHSQRSPTYAAMVKQFDDAIGILWDGLVQAGVENDTIVVFTSDNGGNMYDVLEGVHPTSNFPLRGGKASIYDGGIRVPTAIVWPGVTQANTLSDQLIQSVDFFPTLLNGISIPIPPSHIIDGQDVRPALKGEKIEALPLYTFLSAEPRVPDWLPASASVLNNGWRLIRTFEYGHNGGHWYQLFNLNEDPYELNEIASLYPDRVSELDKLLDIHLLDSDAIVPIYNLNYRANAFDYNTIGRERESFRLPEDIVAGPLTLSLLVNEPIVNEGDEVSIEFSVQNNSNDVSIAYEQFMGTQVSLQEQNGIITFTAPKVATEEFLGFAFISIDGNKIVRRQIGVLIKPEQFPTQLLVKKVNAEVRKGEVASFIINATDENKELLIMDVKSEDLDVSQSNTVTTQGKFDISIPKDYSKLTATLTFSASDGKSISSQTISVDILPEKKKSSGGSPSTITVIGIFILLLYRQVTTLKR